MKSLDLGLDASVHTFQDKLPDDDISVPVSELPDPDADNGANGESVRQQENKWNDLALNDLVRSDSVFRLLWVSMNARTTTNQKYQIYVC